MKKLIASSLMLLGAASLNAEEIKLVNADGSDLSELCIAAVEAPASLNGQALEMGLNPVELDQLACNGMPLQRFIARYRPLLKARPVLHAFSRGDDSPETALCYAAATSADYYQRLKREHFRGQRDLESQVLCNGMPLERFARKYGPRDITAAL